MSAQPIFASEPATTVRQRSPWLLPLRAYAAIFITVALAAYGWKFFGNQAAYVDAPTRAIAKVCIHQPDFAYQQAWQAILGQAKTEVRENLQVEAQRTAQQTVVTISLSRLPAETIVPLVNAVAAAYAQACRLQWKLDVEQTYAAADEKLRQIERQDAEAQKRLEWLRDRRLRVLANFGSAQESTMENPRWTETSQRLANLEEHERNLLHLCTPRHPTVKEIELQIANVRRLMASIPPRITREPPSASPFSTMTLDVPAAVDVEQGQQMVERLNEDLRQAQAAERSALKARGEEPQIDLVATDSPPAPRHATAATLGKALVTATTSIVGLGLISMGASLEPALSTAAELQALVPAPILGVIPATHPGRPASSARHRRLARWSRMAAGLAVLVAAAWFMFLG